MEMNGKTPHKEIQATQAGSDIVSAPLVPRPRRFGFKTLLFSEKYIKSQGYKIGTLVAFAGEIHDSESGPQTLR